MAQSTDVINTQREYQGKIVYFLLAAAGASIAFAVTQTKDATLEWRHALLGAAVLCWGVSFWSGHRYLDAVAKFLNMNADYLRVREGVHPEFPAHPQLVEALRETLGKSGAKTGQYYIWQYRLLLAGAVFYVAWHTYEMFLRR